MGLQQGYSENADPATLSSEQDQNEFERPGHPDRPKTDALAWLKLWGRLRDRLSWRATCDLLASIEHYAPSRKRLALARARRTASRADRAWRRELDAGARLEGGQ